MISKNFPAEHKRHGEETGFKDNLINNKQHTIRANFELWKKRADEINSGMAFLSVRQWKGKPYRSKQVEVIALYRIYVQKLFYFMSDISFPRIYDDGGIVKAISTGVLAKNDGLACEDFREWFKKYDLSKPMAIIQLTNFRY